jgi:mycoredoxin
MFAPPRTLPMTVFHPTRRSTSMPGTITMYSTTWCGYCRRLKSQLDREGIGYTEVNIEEDPASADFVEKVNNGNQVVPTLLVVPVGGGEGVALTNPSLAQVKAALAA